MVRTILGIFLLLCGFSIPVCALPPSDSPGTSAAAQDAAGTVWALPVDNSDGKLRRRGSGNWAMESVPGTVGFHPRIMTRGGDGSVYVFWQTFSQGQSPVPQCLVTVHRGISSRLLAHFSDAVVSDAGFPSQPTISAGAGGDVWLAGSRPLLWHISPDGGVTTFPIEPEWYISGKLPEGYDPHTTTSSLDGEGRRWFWQSEGSFWQPNGLRGVLIWDGKTLDYHPTLMGMPDRPVSVVAPLDTGHFWVATAGDYYRGRQPVTHGALYRVDTHTLSAVAETPPEPGAFQNIVQMFQADGDWYVIEQAQSRQAAILWRERGGKWQKCLDRLEREGGYYESSFQHPWLAEPSGVWLGVRGGAWWLPRGGQPPLWVNWRRGLAALSISGLFPLASGGILAVGPQGTSAEIPATPQPVRPLPPGLVTGGMGAPPFLGPLLSDPRRHLWGTRTFWTKSQSLYEWDGRTWRTHLPPPAITGIGSLYACDTLGRLWLTTSNWHPPAQPQPIEGRAVYDPARDTWTNYATEQEALRAAAAMPGMAFLPYRNPSQPPLFSGDGRVTYATNTTVYLYDGHAWRHWEARGILPSYPYGNLGGPPHFSADRRLEVTLDSQFWDWTPETGWQQAGKKGPDKYDTQVPPNGPRGLWGIPVVDAQGERWFVWQDAVYTAWDGLWAKQDELSGPGSPFRYGYGIEDVLRDPVGRLFFLSRPAGYVEFVVWSPPPVPKPALSIVPTADDAITVRIRANSGSPPRVRWRLNGGTWSAPQTMAGVTLTALPRGDYRVEVQAVDHRLQMSVSPAVAVFSIRVAAGTQIARWLRALLHGTDDEREAAVAGLVKQPDVALPALMAARPGASEAGRWWLDAATQQIMEQSRGSGSGIR